MFGLQISRFAAGILLMVAFTVADDDEYQCTELYEYDASTPGTISSPFYGKRDNYHKKLWCEYKITAPEGHRILLTFKDLDIESSKDCRHDALFIFNKERTELLESLCGSDLPDPVLSKKGDNTLLLLLRTSENGTGRGFLLQYESSANFTHVCERGYKKCDNGECFGKEKWCNGHDDCSDGSDEKDCDMEEHQCHHLYEYDATTVGTVSSPFYGKRNYHDGLWCEYRITAPEGYRIKITFKDVDIDPSSGCRQDQLVVYAKDKLNVLGIFCGTQLPNAILSKEWENEIRLLFRSDFMVNGRGFLLQYESSPYFKSVCDDGYLECKNRNCYKSPQKCDGIDDCGDGTDEEECGQPIENFPEKCGVQEILPNTRKEGADRMVGGEEVVPNSWPWQVSLQTYLSEPNGHFCGGTLLNAQWILTASHCAATHPFPGDMKIHLGSHYNYKKGEYEQVRRSKRIIAYPDLEGTAISQQFTFTHDITLIQLNAPVTFNKGVQPACLPSTDMKPQPDWHCYGTGWGETRGSGSSDALKQMELVIKSINNCTFDEKTQICVEKPYNSPCHGDSGGPLQCKINDKWYVYGAASFVTVTNFMSGLCSGPHAMTVYANSVDKIEWIKTIINKYS